IKSLAARGHRLGPKDGTAIILAKFDPEKHYIEQKNVVEVTGLALDFDGKIKVDGKTVYERLDVEGILAKLPFKGVAHSSYSHTADLPKFRVLLPLTKPISRDEHRRLWWWFYELTGRKADPSGKNCDRIFFLPRAPDSEALKVAWIRPMEGPVLDYATAVPADYLPPEQLHTAAPLRKHRGAHRAPAETRTHAHVDPQQLLARLASTDLFQWAVDNPGDVSREAWRGLATNIAAAVLEDEAAHDAGAALFHEISEYDAERYNWGVTEKTFRDALRSAQSYGPMTFAHFITNGVPESVCDDRGTGAKSPMGLVRMTNRPPKPQAPAPAEETPVESGATPSTPSPQPASQSSTPAPTSPAASSTKSNASSTSSTPASNDSSEDLADDDVLTFDLSRILFDRSNNRWLLRDDAGEWHPMVPGSFNEMLNNMGVSPK
ncbi:MAG: hypothetical protein ACRC8U_13460, partial [Brooklawnia sp.]